MRATFQEVVGHQVDKQDVQGSWRRIVDSEYVRKSLRIFFHQRYA